MDPLNWEISSNNKQRVIYANLYRELIAKGLSRDQIIALGHKLDVMSPGGNFLSYIAYLRETRRSTASNEYVAAQSSPLLRTITSATVSLVPPLDFSTIDFPSKNAVSEVKMKSCKPQPAEVSNNNITKKPKNTELPSLQPSRPRLPFNMDDGLTRDLQSIYIENHNATETAFNKFLDEVKVSESRYKEARKARIKERKRKKRNHRGASSRL